MSKIICNSVEFVLRTEIKSMIPGEAPVLNDYIEWNKINAIEKPVYQSSVKQNDAGPANEETVTVKIRHTGTDTIIKMLIDYVSYYFVLRMSTDEKTFYIGNLEYPCQIEYTSDKIFDTYTFKAVSPA